MRRCNFFAIAKTVERDQRSFFRIMRLPSTAPSGDSPDRREHPDKDEFGNATEYVSSAPPSKARSRGAAAIGPCSATSRGRAPTHEKRFTRLWRRDKHRGAQAPGGLAATGPSKAGRSVARQHQMMPAQNTARARQHRHAPGVAIERSGPTTEWPSREHGEGKP